MKKTTNSFTAQSVTFETTLPFHEVIARLDVEVNKAGAHQFVSKLASASTKQAIVDLVSGVAGSNDFIYSGDIRITHTRAHRYFFEMNHHKWLNVYHDSQNTPPAVVYTIGNPIYAETFMRRDVRAGYNIPPRLMVVQNADTEGTTLFYHLPSSLVLSDDEELVKAILAVDEKLEQMITRVMAD
ncbi:hypothetical protein H0H92_003407 [Tricholoma furcatifolium]|nr:hypothetical protein H0H92_003407 [Tricholoma furcatifolium]